MQKKSLTALLLSSVSFIGMVFLISCVTNTKSHTSVPVPSVSDAPFVQETHTAFQVGNDKRANEVRGIAVDHEQNVWIATADGIFRKPVNSASWDPVIAGVDRGPAYAVAVKADGTILLGTWKRSLYLPGRCSPQRGGATTAYLSHHYQGC